MDADEREEWGESHGYGRYRCSVCGRTFYSDGIPECCSDTEEEE